MPVVIIILVAVWLLTPARSTKTRTRTPRRISYSQLSPLPVQSTVLKPVDPIKMQRERERQQDRARREADRQRKERERIAKQDEARRAAADRVEWCSAMIDRYSDLYEQIETELSSNASLTEYKRIQLQRQLLTIEEKLHKYHEQRDKAFFTAHT